MKILLRAFTVLLAAVLLLSGCSQEISPETTTPPEYPDCPISTQRTGTKRQGILTLGNGFECVDQGSYFMCMVPETGTLWLLYIDNGSDTAIKVCGRPDCTHSGEDCNASFYSGCSICYYDGYLYTFGSMTKQDDVGVLRMNLDGSGQETVFDFDAFCNKYQYGSYAHNEIANGAFTFYVKKLDENGKTISIPYCYKLDGSAKEPVAQETGIRYYDGETRIGYKYDQAAEEICYFRLDPEQGIAEELFRDDHTHYMGYLGTQAEYYCEEGIVYERVYAGGEARALFDTGLRGEQEYLLLCFPDFLAVIDSEKNEDGSYQSHTLHFYDWQYHDLGSVVADYAFHPSLPNPVCGETADRIYFGDLNLPRYYIDKSEFGTGNLILHPLTLPDFSQYEG